MANTDRQSSAYVVYPAALCDGWEVVKEQDDDPVAFERQDEAIRYAAAQAASNGGAVVKLEDWFGGLVRIWHVPAGEPAEFAASQAAYSA